MNPIKNILVNFSDDKVLFKSLRNLIGFYPKNISVYKLALAHRSAGLEAPNGYKLSNERLEFLGDAILGAVVADMLFKKFPYREEGFLTEMRSRIVSRESLKQIGLKMGLDKFVQQTEAYYSRSIYGDALEALIGAVYIDKGYKAAQRFILNRVIDVHIDMEETEQSDKNFKSKILNHAQKEKHQIVFDLVDEDAITKQFTVRVLYNAAEISRAVAFSKKKAEQIAAEEACRKLNI